METTFKKILILENENWDSNKGNAAYRYYEFMESNGVEFKIIERAAHSATKEELIGGMMWCDAILFASTFFYAWDVKGVGDLLMKVPMSKTVIGYVVGNGSLQSHMDEIWTVEELAKMSHHKVYELDYCLFDDDTEDDFLKEINMLEYKKEWDKKVAELYAFNHSFQPTGRKVRIGKITAFGSQWSLLKEGDIVDELDCTTIDQNPARGIWVMGKDEPVKLLNSDGHEEWQFEELTAENLTIEFFSRGNSKDKTDIMETIESWIYHALGKILSEEQGSIELWEWCDTLCKTVGVERRANRRYFEQRLREYNNKYTYFKEPGNDPRFKMMDREAKEKRMRRESRVKLVGQDEKIK